MRVFVKCHICDKEVNKIPYHIRKHNITSKEYYDLYLKKVDEGSCLLCSSSTKFKSLSDEYKEYCSRKCTANCPTIIKKRTVTHKQTLKDISSAFGKSEIIYTLESTFSIVDELETYLHDYFNQYCKVQPSGGGRTEWFDECILEEVMGILKRKEMELCESL